RHTISKRDWSSDVCSSDLDYCDSVFHFVIAREADPLQINGRVLDKLTLFTNRHSRCAVDGQLALEQSGGLLFRGNLQHVGCAGRSEERRVGKESRGVGARE